MDAPCVFQDLRHKPPAPPPLPRPQCGVKCRYFCPPAAMTNRRLFAELSPARAATALACWGFFVVCLFCAVLDERMLPLYYSYEPLSFPLLADTLFAGEPLGFFAHVASFFFTDYLPYFALHALFDGDFRLALPALAFLFGVVGAAGWTLFMQLHTSRKFAVVCVTPLVFGLLFVNLAFVDLPLLRPDDGENHDLGAWQFYLWENAFYLIKPAHRAGTFAAFPFCLWLLARFLHGGGGKRAAALAVVVVAVTASDPIMLAWFFIPAGAFVLWRAGGKLRDIRREFYLLAAVCLAGFLLREIINNYFFLGGEARNFSGFLLPKATAARNDIFLLYPPLWARQDPAGFVYWLASFALLVYAALSAAFGAQTRAAARLLLLAVVASFVAAYLSGRPAPRYMLLFWFGPALFSPLLLVALAGKLAPAPPRLARRAAVVAALFAFAAAAAHAAARPASPVTTYDPAERQCFDNYAQQYNLQKGLAGGMAKPIRAFAQSAMRPYTISGLPVIADLDNRHLAEGDNFNFVVVDVILPFSRVTEWFDASFVGAPPIAKLQCGKYALHVYPSFNFLERLWKRKLAASVADGARERALPPAPAGVAPQGLAKRTPLMRAIRQHGRRLSPAAVSLFARAGDDVNAQDIVGRTPLHYAARRAPADVVAALVAAGAQVDAADKAGITPLHRAAGKVNKAAAVAALLAGGANPNSANLLGETPLHAAAKYANCGILKALIAAGGDPDARDLWGNTARGNLRASYKRQPWFLPFAEGCLG